MIEKWDIHYREDELMGAVGWAVHMTLPFLISFRTPAKGEEYVKECLHKEIEKIRIHGRAFATKIPRSFEEEMIYRPMRNFDLFPPGFVYGLAWDPRNKMWAMKTPTGELIYENDERL